MNNLFAAKLLQNLRNKKGNKGFTLIELLVVVIIIGVLAAVALPNLLAQVGKARETEGKTGVGTISRSQQSYHFESRTFPPAMTDAAFADIANSGNYLGIGVQSDYYTFASTAGDDEKVTQSASSTLEVAKQNGTRSFSGATTFTGGNYYSVLCQTNAIIGTAPTPTTGTLSDPGCPNTAKPIK